MNKVVLMGRLARDPEVRYSTGNKPMCVAKYTLAVNRKYKQQDGQTADFISCIAFGKQGEFAEKYLKQGIKISISGRIQTGSFEKKDGGKVYTTDVVVEEQEFAESKSANESVSHSQQSEPRQMTLPVQEQPKETNDKEWMTIPDGFEMDGLPFV